MVSGIVAAHGLDGLFMCTLMAGVILILLGVTGLGTAVKYIPRPVVIGFTNGIGVLIASTQIRDSVRIADAGTTRRVHRSRSRVLARPRRHGVGHGDAAGGDHRRRDSRRCGAVSPRIPGSIIVLLAGSAAVFVAGLPHGNHREPVRWCPSGPAGPARAAFRPDLILTLLSPALTVAMLGAIESLLSAVVADRMSGDRHDPNVELTAQGIANVLSPLFGGLPATGAIARTATNIRSGARTPVAGMTHAITLLLILLFAAPLARHIPLAMLAGILLIVAYDMGEWREIPDVIKLGPAEAAVWGITFALTVLADLTVAVEAGMILAALALYPPRDDHHDRRSRHARLHPSRSRAQPAAAADSRRRGDLSHSRPVSLRQHRQAARPRA